MGIQRSRNKSNCCQYDRIWPQANEARVKENGKYKTIPYPQNVSYEIEEEQKRVYRFFTAIPKNDKWAIADKNEKLQAPFLFDDIRPWGEHLIRVKVGEKYGLLNAKGKILLPIIYDKINNTVVCKCPSEFPFSIISKNGQTGLIRSDGKIVVPIWYQDVKYSGVTDVGLWAVQLYGKWGFVNNKNQIVVPFELDEVTSFKDRIVTSVIKNEKWYLIDTKGQFVSKGYDRIFFDEDGIHFKEGEHRGKLSEKGEEIN